MFKYEKKEGRVKKILLGILLITTAILTGCADDASVASRNLSKEADMFKIDRRIV